MKTILCDIIQSRSPAPSRDETPPCEDESEETS